MKKVLVVDDQESGHLILRDAIENPIGGVNKHLNCKMISAYSGKEAINLIKSEKPDLVIMDMNMPGIDGYETTRRIKNNSEIGHIFILAVTAQAMAEDRKKSLDVGCDEYVSKPYDVSKLVYYIVQILRGENASYS